MTTENTTTPANTTAFRDAFRDVAISQGKSEAAHAAFIERVAKLRDLGVVPADLKDGGAWYTIAKEELAAARLSKTELAAFSSDVAMKIGNDKFKAHNKINGLVRNIRNHLAKLDDAPAGSKGANGNAERELGARIIEEVGKLIKAVTRDAEEPKVAFSHREMLGYLTAAADLASGKKSK
jgi:hypothetical protein